MAGGAAQHGDGHDRGQRRHHGVGRGQRRAASETPTNHGQFTVTLAGGKVAPTGGIAGELPVGGTATGGVDYAALGRHGHIPAGQRRSRSTSAGSSTTTSSRGTRP